MPNKPARPGVRALVFDAYGTLFDVHSVVSACEELFPGKGQSLSEVWRAKQLEYTWLLSLMGRYEDFERVTERALAHGCKALGLQLGASERARLMGMYRHLEPYPDVLESLQALAPLPLAILSNGSPAMLQAAVSSAGLAGVLTQVLSADEVRVYKPSPRVYQLACQRLGLEAREIGFVSSNAFDVIGAKAFGFWVCWVNRRGATLDDLDIVPDATVSRLTELATLL